LRRQRKSAEGEAGAVDRHVDLAERPGLGIERRPYRRFVADVGGGRARALSAVRVAAVLALVAWSGLCTAKEGDRSEATLPSQRPGFRCVDALLRRIVDDVHPRTPQRLHLGPVEASESGAFLRVYWPQQRAILLIDWPETCTDADLQIDDLQLGWYRTKARIDLDSDVVPTPGDIHGSTYLVDKPWVDRVIAQCLAGETRVIRPRGRKRTLWNKPPGMSRLSLPAPPGIPRTTAAPA